MRIGNARLQFPIMLIAASISGATLGAANSPVVSSGPANSPVIEVEISAHPLRMSEQSKQQSKALNTGMKVTTLPYTVRTQTTAEILPDGSIRTICETDDKKNFLTDSLTAAKQAKASDEAEATTQAKQLEPK